MARQAKEHTEDGAIAESAIPQTPRYRIQEDALIDVHYVEAGSVVETFTRPGSSWLPLNDAAEKAVEESKAEEDARHKQNSRASLQQTLAELILASPS